MPLRTAAAAAAVASIREAHNSRGLLLTTPGSVNWRSGGLSDPVDITSGSDPVWTLDCDAGAALITSEIEAPRLEGDFGVSELGWTLLCVPWFEPDAPLKAACSFANCTPDQLLTDSSSYGECIREELVAARLVLSEPECSELRELGSLVGEALGTGIDAWRPGISTDFQIAGIVSEVLEAQGAKAVCLIVGGDDRLRSYRHPLAVGDVVHEAIMTVVVARRAGLHVAATRICVRRGDDQIVALMTSLGEVNDAALDASRPGGTWGDAVLALERGYEAIGESGAWRQHFQGGPIGFEQREFELAPVQCESPFWSLPRMVNSAIAWNPSLRGGAKIEDTYLVDNELELLSMTPDWPMVERPHGARRSAVKILN